MGGGGVMRAAAKVAGTGVYNGFRNVQSSVPLSEQAAVTARRCVGPAPAIASSADGRIESAVVSVQRPIWELDEWEFAGDEEVGLLDSVHPPPRVVFGRVPTIEEAKEATADLKDAIEKVYFSSSLTGIEGSSKVSLGSRQSMPLSSEHSETKVCVTSESASICSSVPTHVLNAFHLLKESPEVQNVVASLAADENVWNAVMKNEKVLEFYGSQEASSSSEPSGNVFTQLLDTVKLRVMKMVSNLSGSFHNFFASSAEESSSADAKKGYNGFFDKATTGASFFALGVLAILVVLLKRK